jgi:hypothetical protein
VQCSGYRGVNQPCGTKNYKNTIETGGCAELCTDFYAKVTCWNCAYLGVKINDTTYKCSQPPMYCCSPNNDNCSRHKPLLTPTPVGDAKKVDLDKDALYPLQFKQAPAVQLTIDKQVNIQTGSTSNGCMDCALNSDWVGNIPPQSCWNCYIYGPNVYNGKEYVPKGEFHPKFIAKGTISPETLKILKEGNDMHTKAEKEFKASHTIFPDPIKKDEIVSETQISGEFDNQICTKCHKSFQQYALYCPNCGAKAKMKKERKINLSLILVEPKPIMPPWRPFTEAEKRFNDQNAPSFEVLKVSCWICKENNKYWECVKYGMKKCNDDQICNDFRSIGHWCEKHRIYHTGWKCKLCKAKLPA